MKLKYATKIYWSDEDDCFIAKVPALKGCISHGDTFNQAAKNIQEAAELWLGVAEKYGDPIPAPDAAVEKIYQLSPVLNYSKLARLAGLKRSTLVTKLRRHTAFTPSEAGRLLSVVGAL
ncbi:MAG: type II toxin-antitoxin system HicB family antitoxin [Verrucomicrobiales bacterium]|jgi:predicted RNase H-like HicB family nuclease|nr:type II toxin-antitoxin system HicB family antitoxin [Verrucomicrobiales bacterium]